MITPSKTPLMCPFSIFYPCWLQFKGKKYNNIYELYQRLMDWTRNPDVDALYKCYQIRLKQDAQLKYYLLASSGFSYKCEINKWNKNYPSMPMSKIWEMIPESHIVIFTSRIRFDCRHFGNRCSFDFV